MTKDEILTFLNAGYTKADIESFFRESPNFEHDETGDVGEPSPEVVEAQEEQEIEDETNDSLNIDEMKKTIVALNETVKSLSNTIKDIQTANIKKADSGDAPEKKGADEVIKSFFDGKGGKK